jgi:hypothetical protein
MMCHKDSEVSATDVLSANVHFTNIFGQALRCSLLTQSDYRSVAMVLERNSFP